LEKSGGRLKGPRKGCCENSVTGGKGAKKTLFDGEEDCRNTKCEPDVWGHDSQRKGKTRDETTKGKLSEKEIF